jgi:hypothetical protein
MTEEHTTAAIAEGPQLLGGLSNVMGLSILAILLLLRGGRGANFLAGNLSLFAGTDGGRQGQPALPLGRMRTSQP